MGESRSNKHDLDWILTHPQIIITPKPLPEQSVDDMPDENLYGMDDITGARTSNAKKNQMKVLLEAGKIMARLNKAMGGKAFNGTGTGGGGGDAYRMARKQNYKRPDILEGVELIPDFLDVNMLYSPSTVINYDNDREYYESRICKQMKVPYGLFKTEIASSGQKSQSTTKSWESSMRTEVGSEQKLLSRVFEYVYLVVFSPFDKLLFQEVKKSTVEPSSISITTSTASKTIKESKNPSERKIIRDFLKRVGRNDKRTVIELRFESIAVKDEDTLDKLVPLYEMGLVSNDYMKRVISSIYGRTIESQSSDDHTGCTSIKAPSSKKPKNTTATTTPAKITGKLSLTSPSSQNNSKKRKREGEEKNDKKKKKKKKNDDNDKDKKKKNDDKEKKK